MNIIALKKIGKGTAILTLLLGAIPIVDFLISKDVETGTFVYFYILFAGFVNGLVLVIILFTSLFNKQYKRQLLFTSGFILLCYLSLTLSFLLLNI